MNIHIDPAKTIARARIVVDAVFWPELLVDIQPAGSTDESSTTGVGVTLSMLDCELG
jgi:hypothetical protein